MYRQDRQISLDFHMHTPKAFTWFGAKRKLSQFILPLIPPNHRVYCEPYCGSAAILLAKPKVEIEIANDLNGNVINFFRTLRDDGERLVEMLRLTPYAKDELQLARQTTGGSDLERARRFAVQSCQAFFPGRAALRSGIQKDDGQAWKYYVDRLAELIDRLRDVTFENDDACKFIQRTDSPDTVFYVDPPYPDETRTNTRTYMVGDRENHERLAATLSAIKGRFLISSYDGGPYDSWFKDCRKVLNKEMASTAFRSPDGTPKRLVREVVYCNFDPPTHPRDLFDT